MLHGRRQRAVEAVGVEVDERDVGEEADVVREETGDAAVVEVDAGDGEDVRVVQRRRAEDAGVVAHEGPAPVGGQVLGVLDDGVLPRLQRDVRRVEAVVERREVKRRRRRRRRRWRWGRSREWLGDTWKEEAEEEDVSESALPSLACWP